MPDFQHRLFECSFEYSYKQKMSTTITRTLPRTVAPVNIISSDLIKCMQCSCYVHHRELAAHQSTHIPQHYAQLLGVHGNKPSACIAKGSKVKLSEILGKDIGYGGEDISVRTMLPEEVPVPEVSRKQAIKGPKGVDLQFSKKAEQIDRVKQTILQANKHCPDSLDMVSRLEYQEQAPLDAANPLQIRNELELSKHSYAIPLTKVNYYTREAERNNQHYDPTVWEQKDNCNVESDKENDDEVYQIYKVPTMKVRAINQIASYDIGTTRKQGKVKQKISTIASTASGSGFYKRTQASTPDDLHLSLHQQQEEPTAQQQAPNLQCSSCRGFYCRECGSDIPPMYRPAPQDPDYSQNNSVARSYITSRVYAHQGGKTSRLTRCTNCE